MASNMTQSELADWRRFCDGVAEGGHAAMFAAREGGEAPLHPRDAAVLYALRDRLYHSATQVTASGAGQRLVFELPSAYWMRPQSVAGAELFGWPVHLSDDVAWPALRVELARG